MVTIEELKKIELHDVPYGHCPSNPVFICDNGEVKIKSSLSYNGKILCRYEPYGIDDSDVERVNKALIE